MFDPGMMQAMQQMGMGGAGGGENPEQMQDMLRQMGLPEDYMEGMKEGDKKNPKAQSMPSFDNEDKPMSEISRLLEWVSEEHGVLHQEGRLDYFWKLLDDRMAQILSELPASPDQQQQAPDQEDALLKQPKPYPPNPFRYPAIDFCSGVGVQCVEFAKHEPWRRQLDWVPTESLGDVLKPTNYSDKKKKNKTDKSNKSPPLYEVFPPNRLVQLQSALQYFYDTDNDGPVLAADKCGMALYKNSQVKLGGLSRDGYNGRKGKVIGTDPSCIAKSAGGTAPDANIFYPDPNFRLGIKLETKVKPISLKPANLERTDGGLKYQEGVQIEQDRLLLKEMQQRSCPVQVDDIASWETYLKPYYYSKCAIVTYVTVQRGKPADEENYGMDDSTDPTKLMGQPPCVSWKKLLVVASHLLRPGGYLLQYDCASASEQFGDVAVMKEHVDNLSLDLELVVREIPVDDPEAEDPMICMLWQKKKV